MADDAYSHVSSSLIKQIAPLAGDDELSRFIPPSVIKPLRARLAESLIAAAAATARK
jgi:pantetheine-phosphate adenylyltransferase